MASENTYIGPFEIIEWPGAPGEVGSARHHTTQETVSLKAEWCFPLAREMHNLQAAAGGVGIPLFHWFGMVGGKEILIVDSCGPTLEDVFSGSGRYFSMRTLLLLADQLLSRVEFIHSRNIVHGNLSPFSFAFGGCEWQSQQVFLVDFCTETDPEPTSQDDLHAVGRILSYFYEQAQSWEQYEHQYERQQSTGASMPVLREFLAAISTRGPVDYNLLREIFRNAYHELVTHLGYALDLKGPRALESSILPRISRLSNLETTVLFDDLSSTLSCIGRISGMPGTILPSRSWAGLISKFDKMLRIYMVLLCRDRPSCAKETQVMGAYHLPNRLWRDLRWLLKRINIAPESVRLAVTGKAYYFLAALYEAVSSYRIYWAEYLSIVAWAKKELEPESGKQAWARTTFFWQDAFNSLRATRSVIKRLQQF
ncbi:casein kinase family protein [Aspergillus lucknowensis]|uniref:Kinase-like domain-containing protein n=1 Tax=Aspergillus lucknowensis TaxID=176173 RepID=A0ABR4LNQ8_9EURO